LSDNDQWVAQAEYSPASEHISNFGQYKVKTNGLFSDNAQTFAAGYLEGYLTAETIHQHYANMMCQVDCSGAVPPELKQFFAEQDMWTRQQVQKNPDSPYWNYVGNLASQFDGLVAGYNASPQAVTNPLPLWAFTMLNALGDLFDIIPATSASKRPDFKKMSYKDMVEHMNTNGHCSALLKVTPGLEEIYVGHTSWFVYSAMLRIYKTYEFSLANPMNRAKKVTFSSYPAMLSSLDDMYMLSGSEMTMTQTTNSIFNTALWDLVTPKSLLAWQRVRTANQLANSGPEWYELVSQYNSGTYNNQYMILDSKLFVPNNALPPNTLFVIEQIPGKVQGSDVTNQLEQGFWPSYNVPYHKDIYVMSGYGDVDAKAGHTLYTEYQQAPRAKIFRRDQGNVKDMATMQYMMRYNQYQTDIYAEGDPWGAIAARGDLSARPYCGGGYDTKITTMTMLKETQISVVNGPTSQDQAPFQWSKTNFTDVHEGQPDVFDFQFELINM